MSVTGYHRASIAEREQLLGQIDRLISSHVLHGSESLCKLLRYFADHALNHPGVPLKEYQIATEVFGRPAGFDPQVDSTIRVQAGRLRVKLADYYASEGADDSVQVEMPKGTYLVSFHPRTTDAAKIHLQVPRDSEAGESEIARSSRWSLAVVCLSVMLVAALAVIGWVIASNRKTAGLSDAHS